jgi:dTDP-4-amino-4,6-dideoxygalactose transaminase
VASGTDALQLALRAVGVEAGDEVITVPNAAGYTGFAVRLIGARPVYADVDEQTWTMDPRSVERLLSERTRAVVPVHLYGAPARMDALAELCRRQGVALVEDCAQAHGAMAQDRPVGTWGDAACFSFYPTKNLGALGDGGAVVTGDPALAERLRRLRQYGWDAKYHAVEPFGANSRLDELQAALLRVRLQDLEAGNRRRGEIARSYREVLADVPGLDLPVDLPGHVYHLFVVRVRGGRRDALQRGLRERGIETVVHYPVPDYLQPAFAGLGFGPGAAPVAEQLASDVLSLPCYPELTLDEVREVGHALRDLLAGR